MKRKTYDRIYARIDLDAIAHNVEQMRQVINPGTKIMGVIKADGYGHGAMPVGMELERLDVVWGYAVATAEEAHILRRHGLKKPILVLGASFPEQYHIFAEEAVRATVYSLRQARQMEAFASEAGRRIAVHIKIDTGLNRLGFQATAGAAEEIAQIFRMPHILVEGMFTHFAKADAEDKTMAEAQIGRFRKMEWLLSKQGITVPILHCANSAAIIDMPYASMDIVRAGISLYGMWPSDEVRKENVDLRPALSLKSRIVFLKEVEAGESISYGASYTAETRQRIATIPVGYGDGYPRSLSNKGYVLIRGRCAPIRGRICMDQFMADVTQIPEAEEGDVVTLVGTDGAESISMEEIGELSGRFNYELACNLNGRIPRVYVKGGKAVMAGDHFGS